MIEIEFEIKHWSNLGLMSKGDRNLSSCKKTNQNSLDCQKYITMLKIDRNRVRCRVSD